MSKRLNADLPGYLKFNGFAIILIASVVLIGVFLIQYNMIRKEIVLHLTSLAESEMNSKSTFIENRMDVVETAINNHVLETQSKLAYPDSMFGVVREIVESNPFIYGSSISFVPDFYPSKGKLFEPYSIRSSADSIITFQLANEYHDYTKMEFYQNIISRDTAAWSNPYHDKDGAKAIVTTYGVPVKNSDGRTVAVVDADIPLYWLDSLLRISHIYEPSYSVLLSRTGEKMTGEGNLPSDIFDRVNSGRQGNTTFRGEDGDIKYIFYGPVGGEDAGWKMGIVYSQKDIFRDYLAIVWILIGLAAVGLVAIGLIIFRSTKNVRKIQTMKYEKERIAGELEAAQEIQMGMLPAKGNKFLNGIEGIVTGSLIPAREVGGDIYDYFVRSNKLFFCIGDVSGKGIPAALMMSMLKSIFRVVTKTELRSSDIMKAINNSMIDISQNDMFATFFIGITDITTGLTDYCNAGHNPPIISQNDAIETLEVKPNIPLGVISDYEFESSEITLKPNDIVILYTDGVTEAFDRHHNEYGEERLKKCLGSIEKDVTEVIIDAIQKDVSEFVKGYEQTDDMTILVVKYEKRLIDE